jgi:PPOX class probable F420-dependent enzyme
MTEDLWTIIAANRNGVLATIGADGTPQLSNIYYLSDPTRDLIRFSTTTVRAKGHNLLRTPRASLHVAGVDFFNYAVAEGEASCAIASEPNDAAVEELFEVHSALGATLQREGFGAEMVAAHRMVVKIAVSRVYGLTRSR